MKNERREAIVQLVENHNGVWPKGSSFMVTYTPNFTMGLCEVYQQEFEQVARELGWVNGYKPKEPEVNSKPHKDDWHKRGELPPVGSVCAFHKNEKYLYAPEIEERWLDCDELEVLGHRTGDNKVTVAVVWNVRDKHPACLIKEALKPLQSERDKVVDKAHEILGKSNREWCEMLYDAGMLKLPENNQKETNHD